jgi:hypothetical protein
LDLLLENIQFRKTMKCLERNLGITAIHSIFKEIPTDQELAKSLHTAITKGNAKVIGDSTTPPETSIILDFTGQAYNLPKPNTDERCLMELLQLHNNVSTIMLRLDFSDKSHKQQLQQSLLQDLTSLQKIVLQIPYRAEHSVLHDALKSLVQSIIILATAHLEIQGAQLKFNGGRGVEVTKYNNSDEKSVKQCMLGHVVKITFTVSTSPEENWAVLYHPVFDKCSGGGEGLKELDPVQIGTLLTWRTKITRKGEEIPPPPSQKRKAKKKTDKEKRKVGRPSKKSRIVIE